MEFNPMKTIAIIAPGYGASPRTVTEAKALLKRHDFAVRLPDDFLGDHPLHSHHDDARTEHLTEALQNPDIDAIWAFKGGYGSAKIIPALQKMQPPPKPKPLIGFSDVTSLHLYFNQHWHWPTIHAPVLWQLVRNKVSDDSINAVFDYLNTGNLPRHPLTPLNKTAQNTATITATITGGNLKLLQCSIGTAWQLEAAGKILCIEDVDEKPYQIDRMLLHLQQSGRLASAHAIIFGTFHDAETSQHSEEVTAILQHFADNSAVPVFIAASFGHGRKNLPIRLGSDYTIRHDGQNYSLCPA